MNIKRNDAAERLDEALRGGHHPEPELAGLVAVARQLEALSSAPALSEEDLGAARQAFLAEVHRTRNPEPAPAAKQGWLTRIKKAFQPPRARALAPIMATLILIIGITLAVGYGLPGLNRAVQGSLPGDRLYAHKLQQEDLKASLTFDRFQRALFFVELVEIRNQEIARLTQSGQAVPDTTLARLENHLQSALQMASRLPEGQIEFVLQALRQASQNTAMVLSQTGSSVPDDQASNALGQAASTASNTFALADQGLQDPGSFRTFMAAPLTDRPVGPTPTDRVVYPPVEPTSVVAMPSPTQAVFNPPAQEPTSVPTRTPIQPTRTSTDAPTAQPTPTDPPPVLPTPTDIIVAPTQAPTNTPTPTPTPTPEDGPPLFPTPTQISN